MTNNQTDADWEFFAKNDPYWAVLTQDRFHKPGLDEVARREFFLTGEEYIDWVFTTIRSYLEETFAPQRSLDFGCGVGRLLLPLAAKCHSAMGVDVSESMLREAKRVCQSQGVKNVSFVTGDDQLSALNGSFDFINSYIVFQHIPCRRGQQLFQRLVGLLNDGGVGAIHFTYSRSYFAPGSDDYSSCNYEPEYAHPDSLWHHLAGIHRALLRRLARAAKSLQRHRESASGARRPPLAMPTRIAPTMQMNAYLLNPLLQILQQAGVRNVHLAFSDHGGAFGLVLFFQKKSNSPYSTGCLVEP